MRFKDLKFEDLVGLTINNISVSYGDAEVRFTLADGRIFAMFHEQDCCEYVWVDDIAGDLNDLLYVPVTLAEEVIGKQEAGKNGYDTCTWTFYRISTAKGMVVIRWCGQSNGYYSERVTFAEVLPTLQ